MQVRDEKIKLGNWGKNLLKISNMIYYLYYLINYDL